VTGDGERAARQEDGVAALTAAPPRGTAGSSSRNAAVAALLREAADLLDQQRANPFRARAYRAAAETVAGLDEDVEDLVAREGLDGLLALPGVGSGIAAAIHEILKSGRWAQLERLRGTLDPEALFRSIPGIGPALARRIHEALQIDTLEALEFAAHDGTLAGVPGIGPRRAALVRAALAGMLGRRTRDGDRHLSEPPVALMLEVDEEYRRKAEAGRLTRIAPRRFNPTGEAWLPILHTEREGWHFTALYSNTARAHELGRTRDWVVLYFRADHSREGQRTVVTEARGVLAGRRVVRGREGECHAHHGPATPRPGGA
jgi:putative hydrolase